MRCEPVKLATGPTGVENPSLANSRLIRPRPGAALKAKADRAKNLVRYLSLISDTSTTYKYLP